MSVVERGPYRKGGRPGTLGRLLATALHGRRLTPAQEVLAESARAAADAADYAKASQDVSTFTAQARWLRLLMRDLGLFDTEEGVDDDGDEFGFVGEPTG